MAVSELFQKLEYSNRSDLSERLYGNQFLNIMISKLKERHLGDGRKKAEKCSDLPLSVRSHCSCIQIWGLSHSEHSGNDGGHASPGQSGAFLAEAKSTVYGNLGSKAFLRGLVAVNS